MNKLAKYGAVAGAIASMAPLAARAQDMMETTTDSATSTAGAAAVGGLAIVMVVIWFALVILGIFLFIFWIFMIVDVFKRTNWKQENDKTLWIILVIVLGYLGAIVYYFAVKRQLDKSSKPSVEQANK